MLHPSKVLQILLNKKLVASQNTCYLSQRLVEYLGHFILNEGATMDPTKKSHVFFNCRK